MNWAGGRNHKNNFPQNSATVLKQQITKKGLNL